MHHRLGSVTLSQLAFPGESNPIFQWEKSHWDNTVVKSKKSIQATAWFQDSILIQKARRMVPRCTLSMIFLPFKISVLTVSDLLPFENLVKPVYTPEFSLNCQLLSVLERWENVGTSCCVSFWPRIFKFFFLTCRPNAKFYAYWYPVPSLNAYWWGLLNLSFSHTICFSSLGSPYPLNHKLKG